MKKLVTLSHIQASYESGEQEYFVTKDTLITPLAMDYARKYDIVFVTQKEEKDALTKKEIVDLLRELIYDKDIN